MCFVAFCFSWQRMISSQMKACRREGTIQVGMVGSFFHVQQIAARLCLSSVCPCCSDACFASLMVWFDHTATRTRRALRSTCFRESLSSVRQMSDSQLPSMRIDVVFSNKPAETRKPQDIAHCFRSMHKEPHLVRQRL